MVGSDDASSGPAAGVDIVLAERAFSISIWSGTSHERKRVSRNKTGNAPMKPRGLYDR
jgi:hypothetical protein